jgi:tagatose-6-phosphate ketose/aldose isomerase
MPETSTAAFANWHRTEEEIRQQPACWLFINNIDNIRSTIDSFSPPAAQNDLRIVLTGAAPPPLSARSSRPGCRATPEKTSARSHNRSGHKPDGYFNAAHPLLLVSFARSGNSPESVAPLSWLTSSCRNATTCRLPAMKRQPVPKRSKQR